MNAELTKEQQAIKDISIAKNPYDGQCPNRQLWSEGFRAGYEERERKVFNDRCVCEESIPDSLGFGAPFCLECNKIV